MTKIKNGQFNKEYGNSIANDKKVSEWPVVYILNNDKEAYIGETVNMSVRADQHWANPDRQRLNSVHVIVDDTFNKSAILDLESYLIKYMSADGKFVLQNGNGGISSHNYYNRELYESKFDSIWNQLKTESLVKQSISEIENSDLFKYSPYKALSADQARAILNILISLVSSIKNGVTSTTVVTGGPGTGKTILAMYLLKMLSDNNYSGSLFNESDDFPADVLEQLSSFGNVLRGLKVGLVIPQQALRATLGRVVKNIRNIDSVQILKPSQVADDNYDLLIVDEGHRLHRRAALAQYPVHDKINEKLNLPKESTELDWIMKCSKYQVIFYDPRQSVRPSDIKREDYIKLQNSSNNYALTQQFRCRAGSDYIDYISRILSDFPPSELKKFSSYDLKLYDDPNEMIRDIKKKNKKIGLCRTVAGYAWKWVSKTSKNKTDFNFNGKTYQWNTTYTDWVHSENAINEIGCIHTIQGYDLNYVGVIIGRDLQYKDGKIVADKSCYFDNLAKIVGDDKDLLREQIMNVYYTLLTRGIEGTYIYIEDPALRDYFKKYI